MGPGTPLVPAPGVSRRAALGGLGAATAVGLGLGSCTPGGAPGGAPAGAPLASADVLALDSAAVREALAHTQGLPVQWLADHGAVAHAALGVQGAGAVPAHGAATPQRADVLVLGAGVAGLAAARALISRGVQNVVVLDLQDQAGGHAQGLTLDLPGGGRTSVPLAAHYLPVPGPHAERDAPGLVELLADFGLLQRDSAGRWQPEARHLCHSPQERLFAQGQWHPGLLLLDDATAQAQARQLAERIRTLQAGGGWGILAPAWHSFQQGKRPLAPEWWALDAITFEAWLQQEGITHASLLSYLDYCCRDDYGAGVGVVSAWAGVHYFAARHGFAAPDAATAPVDAAWPVFTWPQGNGWLTQRLAAPLGPRRLLLGRAAVSVQEQRQGVLAQVLRLADGTVERWQAKAVVLALPAHVLRRVWPDAPAPLRQWPSAQAHWQLAHLVLDKPPRDQRGPALAWDNVVRGGHGLGVVHGGHQRTDPRPGPTVWTWYHAGGIDPRERLALLRQAPGEGLAPLWADLLSAHPDLPERVQAIARVRHGHGMPCPLPGLQQSLQRASTLPGWPVPTSASGRVRWAHSDCAGYAIFEEAFCRGHLAGHQTAQRLSTMGAYG